MANAIDGADARPRLPIVDVARGVAIAGMVVYHTAFDLYANRLIATDVIDAPGWKMLARTVAGSFLLLVGVGLVLAARGGMNWRRYGRRLAFIVAGALMVTAATWWFDPGTFVFFGILHLIAVASVLALPFLLWAPAWLTAAVAALFLGLPWAYAADAFDAWPLWWVGLGTEPPVTVDYVPLFPWFGVVLAGLLLGRWVVARQAVLARWQPRNGLARLAALAGRWSLVIYLVHQPLIVGAVSLAAAVLPPNRDVAYRGFMAQCVAGCPPDETGAPVCQPLCACMFGRIYGTPLFNVKSEAALSASQRADIDRMLVECRTAPASPVP